MSSSDSDSSTTSSSSSSSSSSSASSKVASPVTASSPVQPEPMLDSEPEREPTPPPQKPPAAKKAPRTTKRRRLSDSDSDDEFNLWRTQRHLFDSKEEYFMVMRNAKSERERESIIFDRQEQYEERQTRARIEKTLAARERGEEYIDSDDPEARADAEAKAKQGKKKISKPRVTRRTEPDVDALGLDYSTDEDGFDAKFHKPTEIAQKKEQKKAMATLNQKRTEKAKKDARKAALNVNDVFGGSSENDSSTSSSSSSTDSSDSSSSSSSEAEEEDPQALELAKPIDKLEDLLKARISRHFLTQIVHTPFFSEVAIGSFVLLRTGRLPNRISDSSILKIIEVVELPNPYKLEGTRTNRALKTKFGNYEKTYPIANVSNSPFTKLNFDEWYQITIKEDQLPSFGEVLQKEQVIKDHRRMNFTADVVDYMVKEKKKHNLVYENTAIRKSALFDRLKAADNAGDRIGAANIRKQIDIIEAEASERDKKRLGDLRHVTMINEKNRYHQRDKLMAGLVKFSHGDGDDPFTRKKERMRVVCGTAKQQQNGNETGGEKKEETMEVDKKDERIKPPPPKQDKVEPASGAPILNPRELAALYANTDLDALLG